MHMHLFNLFHGHKLCKLFHPTQAKLALTDNQEHNLHLTPKCQTDNIGPLA